MHRWQAVASVGMHFSFLFLHSSLYVLCQHPFHVYSIIIS